MLHVDKNRSYVKIVLSRVEIIMLLVDTTCLVHKGQQNAAIEISIICIAVNFSRLQS